MLALSKLMEGVVASVCSASLGSLISSHVHSMQEGMRLCGSQAIAGKRDALTAIYLIRTPKHEVGTSGSRVQQVG